MTLGQYIELLKEVIEARPEARDFEVIFASDDEGNCFQSVTSTPTIGNCSDEYFKEFTAEDNFSEYEDEDAIAANCVCIN